ncbi:MAG: Zn-ribbon domain-containing OB-fold protein [Solirubrobacteraceae bacterium]
MISVTSSRPVPLADDHSQHYWTAAERGELLIQRCGRCGAHQFYPRRHCVACMAADPQWVQACGRGRLHTYSVVHRATNPEFGDDCPYVFAIVELDEGPRISTRIVDAPLDALRCDAPVVLRAPSGDDHPALPYFTLAEG